MEMYEKVKKERDELKENLDQYLVEEMRQANNVIEEVKNAKKSRSKGKGLNKMKTKTPKNNSTTPKAKVRNLE